MASSMNLVCRRIYRSVLWSQHRQPFCTGTLSSAPEIESNDATVHSDIEDQPSSQTESTQQRMVYDRPLENGLDIGVYKAILLGQVGQNPVQKRLRTGKMVTLLSVGTGGIRNNRRPFDNEDPRDFANRCAVQWHRVSIYPDWLGNIAMKHAGPGSILYLEGNLETKIFTDPITGLVRRVREVALRANGRIVFVGKDNDTQHVTEAKLKGVGYY